MRPHNNFQRRSLIIVLYFLLCFGIKAEDFKLSMLEEGVFVSGETSLPEKLHWMGRGQAAGGGAFGLIGAAAGGNMADKDRDKLRALLQDNAIDVGKLIAEAFSKRLVESGAVLSEESEEAPYQIVFTFKDVGFHASMNIGSSKMKPYVGVIASLRDREGAELWSKHALLTNLSGETKGIQKEKLMKDAKLVREAFTEAAEVIADKLFASLKTASN